MAILNLQSSGPIESFNVEGLPIAAGFPISHVTAVRGATGYHLQLSGMIPVNGKGELIGTTLYEQAMQTVENIRLAIAGAAEHYSIELKNPLQCITYTRVDLADVTQATELNKAYVESGMPSVARTAVEVRRLPRDVLVEITASAFLSFS